MTFYIIAIVVLFALNWFLFWRIRVWKYKAASLQTLLYRWEGKRSYADIERELAALKAPRKVPARVGCRIGVTHSDIEGDLWRCEDTPACDWFWRSKRRPVHTRKQHEKFLKQNTGETP